MEDWHGRLEQLYNPCGRVQNRGFCLGTPFEAPIKTDGGMVPGRAEHLPCWGLMSPGSSSRDITPLWFLLLFIHHFDKLHIA